MRKNLKEARVKAGMTQQQLADRLGITLQYYQKIEQGARTGTVEYWDALEDMLGIHQRVLREAKGEHLVPVDHFNVMFGHIPDEYEGDADKFLSDCTVVDEEVKEAIATILRKSPCAVVFGDENHKIDVTAGGYHADGVYGSIAGKRQIAVLIP